MKERKCAKNELYSVHIVKKKKQRWTLLAVKTVTEI